MKLKRILYHGLISIFIVSLLSVAGCKSSGSASDTVSGSAK